MKLFLASKIDQTIDLALREYKFAPEDTPVLYIATGQNCFVPKPILSQRSSYTCLTQRHFHVTAVDLEAESPTTLAAKLRGCKLIVVGGGNCFYLLYHMKRSGLHTVLPEFFAHGGVYMGSSAGSCVMSPDLGYVKSDEDSSEIVPELTDFSGLHLVDVEIYPHCIEPWYERNYTDAYVRTALKNDAKKIFLRDSQALLVKDDMYKIVSL